MKTLNLREVIEATRGKYSGKHFDILIKGVSTDSRTIRENDLFIPLEGPNFDGHDFIRQAFEKGATAVLCEESKREKVKALPGDKVIFVDNTQLALLDLAAYYRALFPIPFVAVTGSVGKTTTKEMIAEVLKSRFRVLKTPGNLNNEIGVPLTMFLLDECHDIGVVEMGMSGLGEIRRLANVVKPKVAVITNIGVTHIEKLGSREKIAQAKMEILEPLTGKDIAVLNADSAELWRAKEGIVPKTVFFGREAGDIRAKNIVSDDDEIKFDVYGCYGEATFTVSLPGVHNVNNALAAIAVGFEMGLSKEEIQAGLKKLKLPEMRLQLKQSFFGAEVIDDAYNASPDSMKAALDYLEQRGRDKKKVAILGDMLELGNIASSAHFEIGKYAAKKADMIVAIGSFSEDIKKGALEGKIDVNCVHAFKALEQASAEIIGLVEDCDIVLVKASRGMKLEQITELLVRGS